jgi:hypothetical protein
MRTPPASAECAVARPHQGHTRTTRATVRQQRPDGTARGGQRNGAETSGPQAHNGVPQSRDGTQPRLELDGLAIRIPMTLRRRGGRKLVIVPEGLEASAPRPAFDPVLINALVRAHRWRRQIESGQFRSASELAAHEKITDSFVARMLCLTLLAPDITQAILEGRQPKGLKLATLLRGVPLAWEEQRRALDFRMGPQTMLLD